MTRKIRKKSGLSGRPDMLLRIAAGLCLTLFPMSASAASSAASSSKDVCKQGKSQYASGDVLKAIQSLNKCVEHEPRNREAQALLGNASMEAGRFPEAVEAFAKAQAIKPGDATFLTSYLAALDGAGKIDEQIPVLAALAAKKPADRKIAEHLLSAVEAAGPAKHPGEYLAALQALGEFPNADRTQLEKLAAAYLKSGADDKAQAEYRGLLEKKPESPEYWAGLGASQAKSDPEAASECYRKAALYSDQASQRQAFQSEGQRLAQAAKSPASPPAATSNTPVSPKSEAPVVASKPVPPAHAAVAVVKPVPPAPTPMAAAKPAPVPVAVASTPAPAKAPSAPAFNLKAFQDSVYHAELDKRLAELHKKDAPAASAPVAAPVAVVAASATAPSVSAGSSSSSSSQSDKDKEAKEKAKQDKLAKEAEQKAKDDKAKQDKLAADEKSKQEKLAADLKAKEEKAKQDKLAADEKARQDQLAKQEKERKEKEALAAELKAKQEKLAAEEKAKQEKLAADEKAKQEKLAAEEKSKQEKLAKDEKERKDKEALAADIKAKEEKAKQEKLAADEKSKQEKMAADLKAKEEKAKQDKLAADEKARQDQLAKQEKERKEKEALAAELKAKQEKLAAEEKAKQEKLAAEEKAKQELLAKQEKERIAREEEQKRIEAEKARKLKEEQDKREKLARERRDRYDHAIALYGSGRSDSAAVVFKAVLADSPVVDAFYYGGRVSLERKEYPQALERFAHGPQDKSDLDGLKGKAFMGMGKSKEALQAFESQYAKTKNDSLLEELVSLKRKNGDEAGAIAYLEKLADRRPGVEAYQLDLAVYFQKQGDKAKTSERYGKVLALNPNHPNANAYLGLEYAGKPEPVRAVPLLEKATVAYPKRADLWKALAQSNAALGRKDAALTAYNQAFSLSPNDLDVARGKLALALEPGHSAQLAQAYEDVLKIAPQDKDASMGLAKLRFKEGDFPAAEKHFRVACADTKDVQALAQFGRTLLEVKKIDEASAMLQKAVDLGDKDVDIHYDLARIRMEKGDLDGAEAVIKDLAKKSPIDPEPMYWQGQIALKRQQTPVAEEFFRKANRLKPMEGRYAEAVGKLLKEKDDFKTAASVLRLAEQGLTLSGKMLYADCLAMSGDASRGLDIYADLYKRSPSPLLLSRRMDLLVRMDKAEQAVESAGASPYMDAFEVQFSLAKAQLALADAHIIKGDVDQAVDLMKKVVKHDDRNAEFHYYLGMGYFGQNKLKKARDEFAEAITYRVDYPEALYRKGLCQIKLEDAQDAENSFGELSQHADPLWKARGLYGLALVFEAEGKTEAVEHHLERSILAQPLPEAMAYLSRVRLKQGRVVEAEESAKRALAADPSHEEATVALANAFAAAKRQSEAMELARQGLRAKPLSCGLLVQSAKLTYESGKLDSALTISGNAIRLCPEEPMGYYYAGVTTHDTNRPKEAKQYFKSFKKLGGDKKMVPEE